MHKSKQFFAQQKLSCEVKRIMFNEGHRGLLETKRTTQSHTKKK